MDYEKTAEALGQIAPFKVNPLQNTKAENGWAWLEDTCEQEVTSLRVIDAIQSYALFARGFRADLHLDSVDLRSCENFIRGLQSMRFQPTSAQCRLNDDSPFARAFWELTVPVRIESSWELNALLLEFEWAQKVRLGQWTKYEHASVVVQVSHSPGPIASGHEPFWENIPPLSDLINTAASSDLNLGEAAQQVQYLMAGQVVSKDVMRHIIRGVNSRPQSNFGNNNFPKREGPDCDHD